MSQVFCCAYCPMKCLTCEALYRHMEIMHKSNTIALDWQQRAENAEVDLATCERKCRILSDDNERLRKKVARKEPK